MGAVIDSSAGTHERALSLRIVGVKVRRVREEDKTELAHFRRMPINARVAWEKPIQLGPKANFVNTLELALTEVPDAPGIYVFARKFGKKVIPLYIGKAANGLRARLKQQVNARKLMETISKEKNGDRVLLLGIIVPSQNQRVEDVARLVERAHIEHALSEGHPLINIQGTKTKTHTVEIYGRMSHNHPFPRVMLLKE